MFPYNQIGILEFSEPLTSSSRVLRGLEPKLAFFHDLCNIYAFEFVNSFIEAVAEAGVLQLDNFIIICSSALGCF